HGYGRGTRLAALPAGRKPALHHRAGRGGGRAPGARAGRRARTRPRGPAGGPARRGVLGGRTLEREAPPAQSGGSAARAAAMAGSAPRVPTKLSACEASRLTRASSLTRLRRPFTSRRTATSV